MPHTTTYQLPFTLSSTVEGISVTLKILITFAYTPATPPIYNPPDLAAPGTEEEIEILYARVEDGDAVLLEITDEEGWRQRIHTALREEAETDQEPPL